MSIPIYKAEIDAGVADLVRTSARIIYASRVDIAALSGVTPQECNNNISPANKALGFNEGQVDLHYLKSILATVCWNSNDDVFDRVETFMARTTPEDKPFNYEHQPRKIIGHITDSYLLGLDGKVIPNVSVIDDLPDSFHVGTNAVLYRFLDCGDKELEEEMKKVIAEIKDGKWFVSMEALFTNFDYAVLTSDGSKKIIQRSEASAFLTKHLRCYGGTGKYEDYRLGRLLRNIVFSGKGLVKHPANPDSIIFDNVTAFDKALAISYQEFKNLGYSTMSSNILSKENKVMATEINQLELLQNEISRLEKTVNAATARADAAEQKLGEMNAQAVQAKIDGLNSELKTRDDKVTSLSNQIKVEAEARANAEKRVNEIETELKNVREEVAKQTAAAIKVARLGFVKEKLSLSDEEAAEFYESAADLSNDKFEKLVNITVKKNSGTTVPVNASGSKNADTNVLNNVTSSNKATLGTDGVNDNVQKTQAALSEFLAKSYLKVSTGE